MDPIIKSVLSKSYNNDKGNTTRPINYVYMNNMDNNKKIVKDSGDYTRFLKNINSHKK